MSNTIKRFPRVTPKNAWKLDCGHTLALQDEDAPEDEPTVEVFIPDPDLYFEDAAAREFEDEVTQVFERKEV